MPELTVNGKAIEFSEDDFPATVTALIVSLNMNPARVVAEVDGAVVPREQAETTALNPDSRVELVQFVGGG